MNYMLKEEWARVKCDKYIELEGNVSEWKRKTLGKVLMKDIESIGAERWIACVITICITKHLPS